MHVQNGKTIWRTCLGEQNGGVERAMQNKCFKLLEIENKDIYNALLTKNASLSFKHHQRIPERIGKIISFGVVNL